MTAPPRYSRPYYFGISVHDNAGDEDHSHTGQTALKLLLT